MSEQNYKAFWDEALKQIHEDYKDKGLEDVYDIWFSRMEYVEDSKNEITISVPSPFMWDQLMTRGVITEVQEKIAELTGQTLSIMHVIKNKPTLPPKEEKTEKAPENQEKVVKTEIKESKEEDSATKKNQEIKKHPQLNSEYTFENFVAGENSEFAYKACIGVAKEPGRKFNPLLIYGGVGLGKTHLMQSIGNYIYKEKNEKVKICYLNAENFLNEYTKSLGNKTTEQFQSKYRNLDVFLLDDIHFLINKQGLQEQIYYTFEALYQKSAQMVFTCDRPINELKQIEERLLSRLNKGTSIDLQPPNFETRRAILQNKLKLKNKVIPQDVIDFIAKNIQTNVRDLEGCLERMLAYSELLDKPLTIEIAQKQLRDIISQPANGMINIETIQKVIADHYNISLSDIKGKKRNKKFVIPRQIAIYIARKLLDYSFPELGNEFGGRDHTTMMHSYEKVEEQLKIDSSFDTTIQMLIREIKDYRK